MHPSFEHTLSQRSIKPTTMRLLVLKLLVESSKALSLGDLEAKFERADKVTLFRTLKTFEQQKLIHRIDDGSGSVKYALCEQGCACAPEEQHVHFHCTKCSETYCLTQSQVPVIQIPTGFRASGVSMVFQGLCPNCR